MRISRRTLKTAWFVIKLALLAVSLVGFPFLPLFAYMALFGMWKRERDHDGPWYEHFEGPQLIGMREARRRCLSRKHETAGDGNFLLDIAGLPIRLWKAVRGVFVTGAQGEGKTLILLRALAGAFKKAEEDPTSVAVVVQDSVTGTLYRHLLAMAPKWMAVRQLNSLDRRAVRVDWAKSFDSRKSLARLARALCQDVPGDRSPHFIRSARSLIFAVALVLTSFRRSAKVSWDILDLLHICTDRRLLREVCRLQPEARRRYNRAIGRARSGPDVMSTLADMFEPVATAAVAAREAKDAVTLDLRAGEVLCLSANAETRDSLDPLYTAVLNEILAKATSRQGRDHWLVVVLDEVSALTDLKSFLKLVSLARQNKVVILAATQLNDQLITALEKPEAAETFTGNFATKIILRQESMSSAEWCSKLIGTRLVREVTRSVSGPAAMTPFSRPQAPQESYSERIVERRVVTPDELTKDLASDPRRDRLRAIGVTELAGDPVSIDTWLHGGLTARPDDRTPIFDERVLPLTLPDFTEERARALGLPVDKDTHPDLFKYFTNPDAEDDDDGPPAGVARTR